MRTGHDELSDSSRRTSPIRGWRSWRRPATQWGLRAFRPRDSRRVLRLVPPTLRVGTRWGRLDHPRGHRGHEALVDGAAVVPVRVRHVAGEAVFAAIAPYELRVRVGVLRRLEKVFHVEGGVVQVAVIHRAAGDVDL